MNNNENNKGDSNENIDSTGKNNSENLGNANNDIPDTGTIKPAENDNRATTIHTIDTMNTTEFKKIKNKIAGKNQLKKWHKITIGVAGIVVIALIAVAVTLLTHRPDIKTSDPLKNTKESKKVSGEDNSIGTAPYLDSKRKAGVFNFLSVGCDKASLSTDSIMIVTYDTKNNKVALAQIPRDSYVQIDGKGGRKINSIFAKGYRSAKTELASLKKQAQGADNAKLETLCKNATIKIDAGTLKKIAAGTDNGDTVCTKNGLALLQDVVFDTFAVTVDYSVFIDLQGFKNMVDIIGGVDMTVPRDMDYDDPFQDLYIHLKAGKQNLNGDKAEQFVRFRYGYANADLGRIDAQKLFMSAFISKLLSSSSIPKIPKLVGEFNENVVTNISIPDAIFFGKSALSMDLNNIKMITWPGVPKYYKGASYFSLNKAESTKLVNQYFNVYSSEVPETSLKAVELVKLAAAEAAAQYSAPTTAAAAEKAITLPETTEKNTAGENDIINTPDSNDDDLNTVPSETPSTSAGSTGSTQPKAGDTVPTAPSDGNTVAKGDTKADPSKVDPSKTVPTKPDSSTTSGTGGSTSSGGVAANSGSTSGGTKDSKPTTETSDSKKASGTDSGKTTSDSQQKAEVKTEPNSEQTAASAKAA